MLLLTLLQSKFSGISPSASEEFSVMSRQVVPGLVCCGIVSAWTWSATLLQSSTAAYTFGSWYGVGGTIQVAIFAMVAAKVKMNANGAHTFLEIVKVRFGIGAHLLFTFYGFLCILVVSGSLLLGGAATVNALTGMNTIAACILLPIGIAVYVVFGGLRATFICDWSHTIILFVVIYIFFFQVYATSPELGSITRMYALLQQAGIDTPVYGNQGGSYLTMKSNGGLVFGAATILSGFSGVFCDQGYWQRAIASAPQTTTKAYMLGGLSWFAIPWGFASCLGLAARALVSNPRFPTYPNPLSASQTSAGLAAPAAAAVVMGKGGAIAMLLVVFMAVTSAASAELIAVSSIFSSFRSLYRTYWRPQASGREIVRASHMFICFWAIWMGCWAVILHKASIDLGWLFYVQGVVLSPAVIPIALTVTWRKLTRIAVFSGSLSGAALGMVAWMIGCRKIYGSITITNLAQPYSAVCSGLTGLLISGTVTIAVSLIKPANYDFTATRDMKSVHDSDDATMEVQKDLEGASVVKVEHEHAIDGKESVVRDGIRPVEDECHDARSPESLEDGTHKALEAVYKRAAIYSTLLTVCVTIIVPLPMFFSHYIFSESFYTFWVVCTILWAFLSGAFCIILPLWESRSQICAIAVGVYKLVSGSLSLRSPQRDRRRLH
ncbi:urea transporter [Heterobasidion irregulare TC 32-1]|uniref:Urea transporter n=1 Tax=Heterobasidion irregulare (strain TC 32-1) TaxID=747525 RepID=W4KGN8_HETIT|nr:urea transporter [Heterobasidion irregulare TC 32-1]ETW85023.1 urea transporter [Heterobasidion irregulare TC 32-1]